MRPRHAVPPAQLPAGRPRPGRPLHPLASQAGTPAPVGKATTQGCRHASIRCGAWQQPSQRDRATIAASAEGRAAGLRQAGRLGKMHQNVHLASQWPNLPTPKWQGTHPNAQICQSIMPLMEPTSDLSCFTRRSSCPASRCMSSAACRGTERAGPRLPAAVVEGHCPSTCAAVQLAPLSHAQLTLWAPLCCGAPSQHSGAQGLSTPATLPVPR